MYKTKEEAFRQLNFDLVVARAEKLMEQRNQLLEQLYVSNSIEQTVGEDYSLGDIAIAKIYSGAYVGRITEMDNEYVTLSSCMKIMGCNMGTAITELDNPEKFPRVSIIKIFRTEIQEPDFKRTVDQDEPKIYKEDKKHEFKIGDHVLVESGTENERTGKIIRLPMEGVDCPNAYVIDLDDKDLGWEAEVAIDGVDCENAWVASETNMELLEVNK